MIEILCTEGLKPNHIEQMSTVMNLDPKTDCTQLTIKDGLPDDVEKHTSKLDEIADFAFKQYENENYLKNMKKDWGPKIFATKDFKGVAPILEGEGVEELTQLLDDHIIKTQSMRGSPYIEPFKEELFAWED